MAINPMFPVLTTSTNQNGNRMPSALACGTISSQAIAVDINRSNQIWLPQRFRVCSNQKPVGPSLHAVKRENIKKPNDNQAG